MHPFRKILLVVAVLLISNVPAFALPEYFALFTSDPFRNPRFNDCSTCHMSPEGGDERNAFGLEFAKTYMISTMLRSQFPDRFSYPAMKVNDAVTIHFSDPENKQVIVENAGRRMLVDLEKRSVDGIVAAVSGGAAPAAATSTATASTTGTVAVTGQTAAPPSVSEVRVDEYAREGAFFGSNIVNLPNGKPQRAGGVDFWLGHRFTQPAFNHAAGDLFGFDSSAHVAYGVRVGLTNRVSVSAMRSNLDKAVEFGSSFQVLRQSNSVPATLQVRAGIEGRNNFQDFYSPYIQVVGTRTFFDRLSFAVVPTFAFNTRDEKNGLLAIPDFAFEAEHNHTISVGLGMGLRILPSTSIVGEYIPRAHGFEGVIYHRPGVSFGLQKSTFRHTFEILFSTQEPMTTADYAVQGTDTFRVGFNIYRKLR